MAILPIAKTFNLNNVAKTVKTAKKPYITPKIEVIDMPDTPKLLATGRYIPEGGKKPYVKPSYRVFELEENPRILTTKPIA